MGDTGDDRLHVRRTALKVALADIPSSVALVVANGVLVGLVGAVVAFGDSNTFTYATLPKMGYVLAAGVCLAVRIYASYRALALGPVSIVVPVFVMFVVTSSVVGVLFLDEALTARRGIGIVLGTVAVDLVASG